MGFNTVSKFPRLWPALEPTVIQLDPERIETALSLGPQIEKCGDLRLKELVLLQCGPSLPTTFGPRRCRHGAVKNRWENRIDVDPPMPYIRRSHAALRATHRLVRNCTSAHLIKFDQK